MSKNTATKKKKSILPISLMLMGTSALLFPFLLLVTAGIQLIRLYSTIGGGENTYLVLLPVALVISVFLAQIFYGMSLRRQQHMHGELTKIQKKWAIALILLGLVAIFIGFPWAIYSMVAPIYPLLNEIK